MSTINSKSQMMNEFIAASLILSNFPWLYYVCIPAALKAAATKKNKQGPQKTLAKPDR